MLFFPAAKAESIYKLDFYLGEKALKLFVFTESPFQNGLFCTFIYLIVVISPILKAKNNIYISKSKFVYPTLLHKINIKI